jgi:hypothetical protein
MNVDTLRESSRDTMEYLNRIAMTSSQRLESREYLRKAEIIVDFLFATGSGASAFIRTVARTALVLSHGALSAPARTKGAS